jgi:NEDD8-activating enzyme E1 regulatory subunit
MMMTNNGSNSNNSNKYDRQLRLWGAAGQKALADTCVILIRPTAAGTETIKNLVLPGVGAFLVVDDVETVTNEYASNFFLTVPAANEKGKSRAQMATELLQELNADVQGNWKHVSSLDSTDWKALFEEAARTATTTTTGDQKILVVASDVEPPLLEKIGIVCDQQRVPLIVVHSFGLIGMVRLQAPPLPILNPKPRDAPPDLRLVHPFGALSALADSIPWQQLEHHAHRHVPYPLILLHLAKEWKRNHHGTLPQTFSEKQEFQATIKAAARDFDNEDNFREAHKNAYLAYTERELDWDHLASLSETASRDEASACPTLYLLLQGLDTFCHPQQSQDMKNHSPRQPPLQGIIPDMTASSEMYVQLQRVYREQASKDLQEMRQLVPATVSDEDLATFCQNVFALDLLKTRSLQEEYHATIPDEIAEDLAMSTMEGDERPDQLPLLWYLGFRACQFFYQQHGRYPGVTDDYLPDVPVLQEYIVEMVQRYKLSENDIVKDTLLKNPDYATEMTRYGNAEIHNVASVIGGVASQEAVKIITGQYVPIDNTYIYNGIASIGGVYRF